VSLGAFVSFVVHRKACGEVFYGGNKKPLRHHGTKVTKDLHAYVCEAVGKEKMKSTWLNK
jgi:hypothetical protein